MHLNELLWTLRSRGLRIERRGDRLAVTGPPEALTPDLREALKEHRDELLAIAGTAAEATDSGAPRPRTGPAPLSTQQESIRYVQELDPSSTAYLLPLVIDFEGPLDVDALRDAYRSLLERHEPLRTRLVGAGEGGEQRVDPVGTVDLPLVEVAEPGEAGLEGLWPRLASPAIRLDAEPPIRALLARRGPELHQLLAVIHHAAADGTSYPLILRDLAALYRGDTLPPMRLTYGDYAAWQRGRWTPARFESRADFWRDHLSGAPDDLGLPTDRPRSRDGVSRGRTLSAQVGPDALEGLRTFLSETGSTLFNALFASFAVALYRHSGRRDFVLGVPVAGRDRAEWSEMVGMFVDQLPVRLTLSPEQSFEDLVRAATSASRAAVDNAFPFSHIVDALRESDGGRRPLVRATVNLLPLSRAVEAPLGEATARLAVTGDLGGGLLGSARYDLTLYAQDAGDRLRLSLVYDQSLYNGDRIEAFLADLVEVIEEAPVRADRTIGSLCAPESVAPLVAIDEHPSSDRSVWSLFAAAAAEFGAATALEDGRGGVLRYDHLMAAAERVARHVTGSTEPGAPVGVLVERSVTLGTVLLGALRSGRPYVPLDPAFPRERLEFMARDAGVRLVLTTAGLADRATDLFGADAEVRVVDALLDGEAPDDEDERLPEPGPDTPAYLLYTSGSTGRPKAVRQSQGNLARHAVRYASALALGPSDRVALLASMAFDAFLMDFFGGLLSGAAVLVVDLEEVGLDRVAQWIDSRRATVVHATPTVFRALVAGAPPQSFSTIRAVDLGGEALRGPDVRLFDESFPDHAALINSYGPSEHTFAFGFRVPRDLWRRTGVVPIGFPVGDVEAVLLDPEGREDPVRGELALRSARNALGYWNRPDEEARAWVVDPAGAGTRLYRTGDVVRRRPDGALVYEHRVDRQVKVRGVRVEPLEVEAVLLEHPTVREVAVWAPTDADGASVLAAAVVFEGEGSVDDLRRWSAARLSGPMTPSVWTDMAALPRTPTGKVDRSALPTAVVSELGPRDHRPLQTSTEHAVADLIAELLGVDGLGADDDFFAIGGHSLKAVELVARIRAECGVDLRLRDILEDSTVAGMALLVDAGTAESGVPLERVDTREPAPLSYAQERIWLAQMLDPDLTAYQMVVPIRVDGPVEVDRLESALSGAVQAHETLRTRVEAGDGRPVQVVDERPASLRRVDDPGGDLGRWVAAEKSHAIDLATEHPFRALIVNLGPDRAGLILTFHHIAVDGVSIHSFFDDFRRAYQGERIEAPRIRYRDFARWERRVVASAGDDLNFWRAYLADAPDRLELPTDRPRPARQTFSGARVEREVRGEALDALRALLKAERSTLFMGLLAATATAIHRQSGQRDMVLGTPVTGRVRSELFGVVGMFADQLPLRMAVERSATLRERIQAARSTAVDAFRHQGLPFPKLLEGLGVERPESSTPLFQAMVNVLPPIAPGAESAVVQGVRFSVPSPDDLQEALDEQSKFDFTVYGQDRGNEVALHLVYNRDLYAEERMERLLDDVVAVLEAAVDRADDTLATVFDAGPESPNTIADPAAPETVPARFARMVEEHGDRTALVHADGTEISYRQLAGEVATLSRRIAALDLGPGTPVGILLGHTPRAAAAILAVLEAGHPYLPLDRRAPRERLEWMVSDSGVGALLADAGTAEFAADILGDAHPVVTVDEGGPEGAPGTGPRPDDLAYLLYTSGSTGRPKAVRQSHANLVVQAARYAEALGVTPDDRLALLASISFDAHLMDLFGALLRGAAVVFVDLDTADLARLPEQMESREVRVLHTTPTVFRTLLRSTPAARWEGVRAVVLGGEPTRATDVAAFDAAFPAAARLYDLYGASEHSFAIGGWVDRKLHERTTEVPLGRPVGDVEAVLLDEDGRPDPVLGGLALRSAHGALGYHGRPDLEAEAWIADPDGSGRRLYRTGDRVRRRPDGRLVYLGRADDQLKIRGHRIEPGEVESVLESHPSVFEVGVHGPLDESGERVLVACVVAKPGRTLDPAALIDWCSDRLPRAMVPTRWMTLDFLPRTVSGKIDRRRLPLPAAAESDSAGAAPGTPAERAVAALWAEVLGREQVGVDDDFFELGGHSLLAVQVVARLRAEFDAPVSLRDFFDHPTVGGIAALLDAGGPEGDRPVVRVETTDPAPLSYAQERVWLAQRLDPELTAYQMVVPVRIEGPLDPARLERALAATCGVHDTLRTRIEERSGRPVQVVDDAPVSLERIDDEGGTLERWVQEAQQRTFDLGAEHPFRAQLVRLERESHALILTFHHLAVDGVSIRTFFGDLRRAYRGEPLQEAAVRYRDFTRWERRVVEERGADDLAFWRDYLAGAPRTLDLATDRPRGARQSFSGARIRRRLDEDRLTALRGLLSAERSTLFMGLLSATATALHRHSGQRDMLLGTPVTARVRSELFGVVGMFAGQLPLRLQVERGATLRELLQSTRDSAVAAFRHQDLPFPKLLEGLEVERVEGRTPLFQAMVNVLPRLGDGVESEVVDGVRFSVPSLEERDSGVESKFDFTLYAQETGDGVTLTLAYNRDLYSAARMEALLDDVVVLLERGAERPDERPEALLAVAGARLVDIDESSEPDRSMWHRFVEVAQERGDAVAVDDDRGGSLSWVDLQAMAERVAARLVADIPGDGAVGVMVDRSVILAPALFGVLRSGRPWVPLDPDFPAERLQFMAGDAGVGAILTTGGLEARARALAPAGAAVVVVESLVHSAPPVNELPPEPAAEAPAYLLYTSGSTGRPKAVRQSQGNLARHAARYAAALDLESHDRVALLASMAFDAFLMDFFGALHAGATVAIFDPTAAGLDRVAGALGERGATVLHTTPTLFRTLVRAAPDVAFPTIRVVDLGGEAVRGDDVRLFDERFEPRAALINSYGPSEHTFAFGYRVPRELWRTTSEVPIGYPLGDVEAVLLDEEGREDSVLGELALRSARNALGYRNRPEEEARAWIPDPGRPGSRLYRTGDVVRRRPDGALVYEHRIDRQVKIRGVRVEPSEVEQVIAGHPSVSEVAVWAPTDDTGTALLAAAVVFAPGGGDLDELRAWSAERLSGPMTPTAWRALPELPRTPTGKIDRGRLELPAQPVVTSAGRAPNTDTERAVAALWAEVLGREQVGADDDFFALGGHSLRGVQIAAGVREAFAVDLPLRQLFEHPTVEATAAWIDAHRDDPLRARPPLTATGAADRPSAPSFAQERMWFMQEVDPEGIAYNLGVAFLERGELDLERLGSAFREVGRRHAVLRARFRMQDGRLLQSTVPGSELRLELRDGIDDGSDAAIQRAVDWISSRLHSPYDLDGDPLARLVVAQVGPQMHAVGVGMHHIAGDVVSVQLLLREIAALYADPDPDALAPLPIQYADFATWQRDWLQGAQLEEKLGYWTDRLEGLATLDLAVDRPRPKVFNSTGATWSTDLDPVLVTRLHEHAAREGVTPFSVLLAAFTVMLHAYSRQTDVAVGVPVAHRDHPALESLIGLFVNTMVVRTDLGDDPTFRSLVERVRDEALEAMGHGDLPFELLVRELVGRRNASRPPLVQVLFNVVHTDDLPVASLSDDATPLELGRDATQLELGLAAFLGGGGARITISYATALFDAGTVEAMAGHFLNVLERGLAEPEHTVAELRAAPASARARLRVLGTGAEGGGVAGSDAAGSGAPGEAAVGEAAAGGEAPGGEAPDGEAPDGEAAFRSVAEQVAARAAAHPDRVAVSSADGAFTYGELVERARSVTATLAALGVGRGDRVAVMMERGHDMVAALLGILGSGAAYVPLDPSYPESRVEFMLDDSGAVALVTHRSLHQGFDTRVAVVDVDRPLDAPAPSFAAPDPEDPAYVIYTSGSTGTPKGVVLPHRSMVNFLASMARCPGFTADDVLVAVTTISFDISVLELYLPLVQGGRVYVASEREAGNGRALGRRLESEQATHLQATPVTWKVLLAARWQGRPGLRALAGGEALPPDLAASLVELTGELWNMYGPTETTVWSTVARIEAGDPITIGGPIDATRLLVVDAEGREVPLGVPGELWIGGAGVALGYHNRPELTAERFVERAMEEGPERFYRTGDLVRWRADGRLEHLGRMDDQVKVRGFRIELGEVESALRSCPGVVDAACAARDDRLIAWFVPEEQPGPTIAEFRGWMRDRLPAYMMPALFAPVEEIPLTPNGKVDRRALPDPGAQAPQVAAFEAPEGELETLLAAIWAELLEVERVGAGDYFFELGGHSLLAMQAVAAFEERSGRRLEPRALFFNNVRELAASAAPMPVEQS